MNQAHPHPSNSALGLAQQALILVESSNRLNNERFENEKRINVERASYVKEALDRLECANKDIRDSLNSLMKNLWVISGTIILMLLSIVGWFLTKVFNG